MKISCACPNQNLAVMDFLSPLFGGGEQKKIINRVCLNCHTHWYGEAGKVRTYTRKEWDAFMEKAV